MSSMTTGTWTVQLDDLTLEIDNLKEFCGEKGLSYSAMIKVARGNLREHKGWTCKRAEGPPGIREISPEAEVDAERTPMGFDPEQDSRLPIRTLYEKYVGPFSDAERIEEIRDTISGCCSKCTGSRALDPAQCKNPSCVLFAYLGPSELPPDFTPIDLTKLIMDFCSNACEDRVEPYRRGDICDAELCKFYSHKGGGRVGYIGYKQHAQLDAKLKSLEKTFYAETVPVATIGTEPTCPYFGTDYDEEEVACQECMKATECVQRAGRED